MINYQFYNFKNINETQQKQPLQKNFFEIFFTFLRG